MPCLLWMWLFTTATALDCWTKDVPAHACCPMNDDAHECFVGKFTHKSCCSSIHPVLKGCNCSSFYLEEVLTFLRSLHGNYIRRAKVHRWPWKYHPKSCTAASLWRALDQSSRADDECVHLEKLHYLVLCGLQTAWWGRHGQVDRFWNEIMTQAIKLLSSTCEGLLTPKEVFHNYKRFQTFYFSNAMMFNISNFQWERESVERPTELPKCAAFRRPTVHCAVIARLPEEVSLASAIMQTWGRDCDSTRLYVAQVTDDAIWRDRRSGIEVMNLAKEYPVLLRHPDQVGHISGDEDFLKSMFLSTNLIRKALAMWHWVGTRGPPSDFICRLDPDTLFMVDRFRRYVHRHCVRKTDDVYLGQVLHYLQKNVGAFPDGGSGICLPYKAAQKFASLLEDRVHKYVGGDQAEGLPGSCEMLPGHLDDVVSGLCFHSLEILPHHALESSLGQYLFNGQVMPRDASESLNGSFDQWIGFRRLHHLFQCEKNCKSCNCSNVNPEFWVDERNAITFHRYKNTTSMRNAYHDLRCL